MTTEDRRTDRLSALDKVIRFCLERKLVVFLLVLGVVFHNSGVESVGPFVFRSCITFRRSL